MQSIQAAGVYKCMIKRENLAQNENYEPCIHPHVITKLNCFVWNTKEDI